MKIKHLWSILCKESIVNQDDNVISIIGVLEELNTNIVPADPKTSRPDRINIPFNFEIVSYWLKDLAEETTIQIKTVILDPNQQELANVVNESTFQKELKGLRSRIKASGLPITQNGIYHFMISYKTLEEKDYKLVSELPLIINVKFEDKMVDDVSNSNKSPIKSVKE